MKIRLAHSPDADDAFMFHGLASGAVRIPGLEVEHVLSDIEALNQAAHQGTYEVTAISFAGYPEVQDRYRLLPAGASLGDGYGPRLVARKPLTADERRKAVVAIPGERTSAAMALRLHWPGVQTRVVPFDRILDEVASGRAEVGLVIHEGQLSFQDQGLVLLADLGKWWQEKTGGLPLPLGANAIRRDLGDAAAHLATRAIRETVSWALAHRDQALSASLAYARGLDRSRADQFVGWYVNDLTLDLGERGRAGLDRFYREAVQARLLAAMPRVDIA